MKNLAEEWTRRLLVDTPEQSHPIGHILRAMRGRIVEKGVATETESRREASTNPIAPTRFNASR